MNGQIYAVLTGDVVKSSTLEGYQERLREALDLFEGEYREVLPLPVDRFSGDSFQVLMNNYARSLRASLYIYTKLASFEPQIPVRISIGLGKIDGIPQERVSIGDGRAFRLSGSTLEGMKNHQRVSFRGAESVASSGTNLLLQGSMDLLSGLLMGLSPAQAEVLWYQLRGYTQTEIARKTLRTQQTVSGISIAGNWRNIEGFVDSFEEGFAGKDNSHKRL